ncbi:hypothetical protein F5Y09DRAFT_348856 [Xylaria sp. FL1042]|nr:hypothetical protein F5Y09DRAFT_348856 [Xylaria sp. FL1042]
MYLPQCEGPKLGPFESGPEFNIAFVKKLGDEEHSNVWKVIINGAFYALKMFPDCGDVSLLTTPEELPLLYKHSLTDSDILNSSDPFINECRAYGRLKEIGKEDVAAKCYGYLLLEPESEESEEDDDPSPSLATGERFPEFRETRGGLLRNIMKKSLMKRLQDMHSTKEAPMQNTVEKSLLKGMQDMHSNKEAPTGSTARESDFRKSERWQDIHATEGAPIRSIVKKYIESEYHFAPEHVPKMLRNLKLLHRYGILHQDIQRENYKNGLLLNFSTAQTVPHYMLNVEFGYAEKEDIYRSELNEALNFDEMIDEWNDNNQTQIWDRFLPSRQYRDRLRSDQDILVEENLREGDDYDSALDKAKLEMLDSWLEMCTRHIKWHAADYDWKKPKAQKGKKKKNSK